VTEKEAQNALKKLKRFMMLHKHNYSDHAKEFINENFLFFLNENMAPDILMQIYYATGIQPNGGPFYNAHINKIQELFGLDKNILDVASGKIPAFASQVASIQRKIGKGTITLYEPMLIHKKPKYPNMTLHKEEFDENISIKEFDLVTGILPCEATEAIIKASCKNQKDFYIAMCGCTHFEYTSPFMSVNPYVYQDYVLKLTRDLLQEYDNGELVIDYLPEEEFGIDYPILYNRKK
jgi:hypothetical protein